MKTITAAAITGLILVSIGAVVWAQQDQEENAQATTFGLFDYADTETIALGAQIYDTNCASCHGADLQGQENWRSPGPNGRALAPPHDVTGHTWHHPDAQLFQIVKFGTAALVGNGYESDMAGYEGVLTDSEILAVMAYIKSTWPADIIERHDAMNAAMAQ